LEVLFEFGNLAISVIDTKQPRSRMGYHYCSI